MLSAVTELYARLVVDREMLIDVRAVGAEEVEEEVLREHVREAHERLVPSRWAPCRMQQAVATESQRSDGQCGE